MRSSRPVLAGIMHDLPERVPWLYQPWRMLAASADSRLTHCVDQTEDISNLWSTVDEITDKDCRSTRMLINSVVVLVAKSLKPLQSF